MRASRPPQGNDDRAQRSEAATAGLSIPGDPRRSPLPTNYEDLIPTALRSAEDTNPTLERLEAQERAISARRARLHDRIDFLRANGNADGMPATTEQLEAIEEQERALSKERKELHARISDLRAGRDDRGAG